MTSYPPGRLMTLDALRGATIAAMILVNTPGSWDHVYSQLLHADWVGTTFTDLIFPLFLLIAGVAMWFSFKKVTSDGRRPVLRKILRRASLIFLVGLFIEWFPFYDLSSESLHFAGVLQRIAVSYVIASMICVSVGRKWIAVIGGIMLLGYWGLVAWSGAPEPYAKDTVFSKGIDFVVLRSCLSSAVPVMIGYLVGSYVDRSRERARCYRLIGVGLAMILLGRLWGLAFPIIKSLFWSSSYVVFIVGVGIVAFGVCLWIIERSSVRSWVTPFVMFGVNPLFIYVLSILLDKLTWVIRVGDGESAVSLHTWIFRSVFQPLAGDLNGSLLYAVCFVAVHWLVAWWLYSREIYVKI